MPENDFAPVLPTPPDFLAHGGTTAALISAQHWHATCLGPLQSWPGSLKCVLSTVLGSPKPMYILWGPEFLFFFNDACGPLLGARLQGAMGRPFAQVWPELWGDFEPKLHQALAGRGSTYENMPLMLERHGQLEPTWWTFSHLCLRNARGAAVGVHCIFNETTALVRAQAREAFWLELASALQGAHTPEQLKAVACSAICAQTRCNVWGAKLYRACCQQLAICQITNGDFAIALYAHDSHQSVGTNRHGIGYHRQLPHSSSSDRLVGTW